MEELEKEIDYCKDNIANIQEELEKNYKKIEMLEEKIKTLKNKSEDTANDEWMPNVFEGYYYVDLDFMEVCDDSWGNTGTDNARLNHKVIFKTEKEAEEYLEYLEEKEKHMNTFTEEEWQDEDEKIEKWYYEYDCEDKKISYDYGNLLKKNIPYFKTKEETIDFTKKYKWQIKHELGVK